MSEMRLFNALHACNDVLPFPNNLAPAAGRPQMSMAQWAEQLAGDGVTGIRLNLSGRNRPLGFNVGGFEYAAGQYNDWNGRLQEMVGAFSDSGLGVHVMLSHNEEFRTNVGWGLHGWNVRNGGWMTDRRKCFTDPRAITAMERRIDAVYDRVGAVLRSVEVMAEMPYLYGGTFGLTWAEQQRFVEEQAVPWMARMVQYCKAKSSGVLVSGGNVEWVGAVGEFKSLPFKVAGLDFCSFNIYSAASLAAKMRRYRKYQAWLGVPLYVSQCAPWSVEGYEPYRRDVAPHPKSKRLAFALVCAEHEHVNGWRWPEAGPPRGPISGWWGIASPEMSHIGGITRGFAQAVDLSEWKGQGRNRDGDVEAAGLESRTAWGDGSHVKAFLGWSAGGEHDVTVGGLEEGEYAVSAWNYLQGTRLDWSYAAHTAAGRLTFRVPTIDGHVAIYVDGDPDGQPPKPPLDPDVYTLRVRDSVGAEVAAVELVVDEPYQIVLEGQPDDGSE